MAASRRESRMAGARKSHMVCSLFLLCAFSALASSIKLNVPRVLIPYFDSVSVNFTLEFTEPGCFKWSTSRSDVVKLHLVNEDTTHRCSSGVVLSSVYKQPTRATAIILAEDYYTGETVRCDVIVDVVSSLAVITTTRQLFIEEAQEEFEIRAYDVKGNEFTTLEGIPFKWEMENCPDSDAQTILQFVRFQETPYTTTQAIYDLEEKGLRGNRVLLEGLRTGCAMVRGVIQDPFYKHLSQVEVKLSVVANLILEPVEIYVVPGSVVHYRVLNMQQRHYQEIAMPSRQYYLEIDDTSVAKLDTQTSNVTASAAGDMQIFLRDRNVHGGEDVQTPAATLHVRDIKYISLTIFPHQNWALMVDEVYEIVVEVYDIANNKIYPSNNVKVETKIPGKYFDVIHATSNGTYNLVSPVKPGEVLLEATLKHVTPVHTKAKVTIFDRVLLSPKINIVPWDPVTLPKYEVALNVTGGGDKFHWSSTNESVAQVTQKGIAMTNCQGVTTIKAAMTQNIHNFGTAKIYVLPALSMEILQDEVEGEVNMPILISLAFYTYKPGDSKEVKVGFSQCKNLPFKVQVADNKHFHHDIETYYQPTKPACAVIPIVGTTVGHTTVTVSYGLTYSGSEFGDMEKLHMKDSVQVATFRKLRVVHPSCGLTVLAVGSSRTLVFEGGPRPWTDRPSGYLRQLQVGNSDLVTVTELKVTKQYQDTYVYRVMCETEGETTVTLLMGNNTCPTVQKPVQRMASVTVICATPHWIFLKPQIQKPEGTRSPCPMDTGTGRIAAHNYQDFELTVIVKDEEGRTFDNISSLMVDWHVSDPALLALGKLRTVLMEEHTDNGYPLCGRSYQILVPKGKNGPVEVSARVIGYRPEAVNYTSGIFPEILNDNVVSSIDLNLVDDAYVIPTKTSVFNHPSNKMNIQVHQGSGFFEFDPTTSQVAELVYFEGNRTLQVIPLVDGRLKVTVKDLCLTSRKLAVAEIQVSGVNLIEVSMADKLELGKSMEAVVQVFDVTGNPLPSSTYSLMDLRPEPSSHIISIKALESSRSPETMEARYLIQGDRLGDTTLIFLAGREGQEVSSVSQPLQVFPPLRLSPRNITLFRGSVIQVSSRGGPQPDATVEYSVGDVRLAEVTAGGGLIEGLHLGSTHLYARALGTEHRSGRTLTYSQDQVEVHVVPLEGVRIHTPVTRLRTQEEMPVYAVGVDQHQKPSTFASNHPFLRFRWEVDNKDVAEVVSIHHQSGIEPLEEDRVAMRLLARRPGRVVVRLVATVTGQGGEDTRRFQDEVEIEVIPKLTIIEILKKGFVQVFESLHLLQRELESDSLLMTPNTEVQLRTNRDGTGRLSYRVAAPCPRSGSTPSVVQVDRNGVVVSSSSIGRAVILVTLQEDFGLVQSLSVLVEVKPVTYLMLSVKPAVSAAQGSSLSTIPRGLRLSLSVSFHDSMGVPFSATGCRLKFRPTRFDLVQLSPGKQNNTLSTHALRVGRTALKVWDENEPRLSDYIMLSVGEAILPAGIWDVPLIVGDVVCFSCAMRGMDGGKGTWEASHAEVLRVDAHSGVGIVVGTGVATLVYHVDADVITSTEIVGQLISQIEFQVPQDAYVTNGLASHKNSVPFVMKGLKQMSKTRSVIGHECSRKDGEGSDALPFPFTCSISFVGGDPNFKLQDLFTVTEGFSAEKGTYQCEIIPLNPPTPSTCILKGQVVLMVRVPFSGGQPEVTSSALTLPFLPGFYLHTPELHLSNLQTTGTLSVSGSADILSTLQVLASDSSLLAVGEPESQSPTTLAYSVHLKDAFWIPGDTDLPLSVTLVSTQTLQSIVVPVRVKLLSTKADGGYCVPRPSDGSWSSFFLTVLDHYQTWFFLPVFAASLFVSYVAYQLLFGPGYYAASSQSGVFLDRSTARSTGSPGFNTSTGFSPSPPSSPRPDYGRRLWSQDSHTYYGSPQLSQRSPRNASYT